MTTRTKEQDKWHERGFAFGTCVAAAMVMTVWGDEVAAREILTGAGLDTRAKCKALGVDTYDLDQLKDVFKTIRRRKRRNK
jgi:hypothetical protein